MSAEHAKRSEPLPIVRTRQNSACWLCGAGGTLLFDDLRDHLFGAPGTWSLRRCVNAACGMVWLDPVPLEDDLHHIYRTYYTHTASDAAARPQRKIREAVRSGYLQGALGYRRGLGAPWHRYLRLLAHLYPSGAGSIQSETMFLSAPRFPARLLDVGCGNGDLLVQMRSLGWSVEGIEVDAAAAGTARARGLEVRQGELFHQQYPADSFDAVTMSHLIEHVYDPVALLQEARRVLKPTGTLIVLTPNSQSMGARLYGRDWRGWEPPRHLHIFNLHNMRAMLERAGLAPIRVASIARWAGDILAASAQLSQQRVLGGNAAARTHQNRLPRVALQIAERFLTAVNGRAGEEILAVASKNASS